MEDTQGKKSGAQRARSAFKAVAPVARAQKTGVRRPLGPSWAEKKVRFTSSLSITLGSLIVAGALVSFFVVGPVVELFSQTDERNKTLAQLQMVQQRNEELKAQVELWRTPAYVEQQARERMGYTKPGEVRYTVIDPGPQVQSKQKASLPAAPPKPWFLEVVQNAWQVGNSRDEEAVPVKGDPTNVDPGASQKPEQQSKRHH